MILSDEDIEDILNRGIIPRHGMMSGCNIKTSCFALFLSGLDCSPSKEDKLILDTAILALDNIQDDVMFYAMGLHYPVDDISPSGLVKLAKVIVIIDNATIGKNAEDIPVEAQDSIEACIIDTLGLKDNIIMMDN